MGFADHYLAKLGESILPVSSVTDHETRIIVIIPAYNESGLTTSLDSLFTCTPPACKTEVLILINWPEYASIEIKHESLKQYSVLENWIASHKASHIRFIPLIYPDMPAKHAGVGLARKTLMDEAVRHFNQITCPKGVIVSFDADSTCDRNYLQEIEIHFLKYPKTDGCSVYFEHPVSGQKYSTELYSAITLYELHLRYYVESIRYTGFPNSFHTIGSSFAVRADAYCRQGGMNKRKAGEDFYFLQKFFELGTFNELNSSRVIPSPRPSDRVPFGTGAAITKLEQSTNPELYSYNPASFYILKNFFILIPGLFESSRYIDILSQQLNSSDILKNFLDASDFNKALSEVRSNSASQEMFEKRFYRWFNLFKILKFLNYAKEYLPDIDIVDASKELICKTDLSYEGGKEPLNLLEYYRKKQRVF